MAVIHRREGADTPCFAISGEFTIDSAGALKTELLALFAQHRHLQLSLAAVDEFDSSAVQVLLYLQREAVHSGVVLEWLGFSPAVSDVLQLLNLHQQLGIVCDAAGAPV